MYNIFGITNTEIIFIESFCRVKEISLTGKLMYYIADKFIVHWPDLISKYPSSIVLGEIDN